MIDWYRRSYPDGPQHEPRCLHVLAAWQALYNIPRTGKARKDGGFRALGAGIEVHLQPGTSLSTFDDDGLTRLVVAAHQHQCRVELSVWRAALLILRVTPRQPDGEHFYDKHPTAEHLASVLVGAAS